VNDVDAVRGRFRELLAEIAILPVESVPNKLDFADELETLSGIDSLDALKFGLLVSEEFGIEDLESVLGEVATLQELAEILGRRKTHAQA